MSTVFKYPNTFPVYVIFPKTTKTFFLKHVLISLQVNKTVSFKVLPSTVYTQLATFSPVLEHILWIRVQAP
jgi:hypothetical protein